MDKIKFYKASALIKSIKSNLPEGDELEMNHVEDYHSNLRYLEEQIRLDLAEFQIPPSAIKTRDVLTGLGQSRTGEWHGSTRTEEYCDAYIFRKQLDALVLFIDAYLEDLRASQSKKQ